MAQVAALQLALCYLAFITEGEENGQDDSDTLLTVEEAASKPKCWQDWVYRKSNKPPFAVRACRGFQPRCPG